MEELDVTYLNKSYSTVRSNISAVGSTATGSSKAVLAALRALQDKIRRLESERAQALDENAELKQLIKQHEIGKPYLFNLNS